MLTSPSTEPLDGREVDEALTTPADAPLPTPAEQLEPLIQRVWGATTQRAVLGLEPTAEAIAYRDLADAALALLNVKR